MVESSAYMSTLIRVVVLNGMAFINTVKNSGPKIDPWGIPVVISACFDCLPLEKTNCLRSDRYDENHRIYIVVNIHIWPIYPVKLYGSQDQKVYAGLAAPITSPLSIADVYLCTTCFSAVSHECLARKPLLNTMQLVVGHDIGIHDVLYMSLQYLAESTQD